jgi:hypothetical protein
VLFKKTSSMAVPQLAQDSAAGELNDPRRRDPQSATGITWREQALFHEEHSLATLWATVGNRKVAA